MKELSVQALRCGVALWSLCAGWTICAAPVNYDRDIRPILSENCFSCHGQDAKKRMAGLRLDTAEGAKPVLTPGKPETSKMYGRITEEKQARRMPPPYSNRTLQPEQIASIKRWIEEGGQYSQHWAFVPPVQPVLPQVANSVWVKQPIDAFVLSRLETEGLKPSAPASSETWLRRVSLDLTGLPPSPAELTAFAKDAKSRGERAYESAVDRLLASSAYGERMAMDWMDVARYADTHGFNNDAERSMWRWRDWVIQSFNRNMPYNQFLTEQLAGDLLPRPTLDQRIATGFGRNHVINSEGGIIEEEYRVEYVADRVRTLGMAWLGLTLECAHCHDHKFDPITQRDHYRFSAFFNNVAEAGEDGRVANAVPMIPAPTSEQQKKMQVLEAALAKMPKKAGHGPGANAPDPDSVLCDVCAVGAMTSKPMAVSKHGPFTISALVKPAPGDDDVAILSAIDYSQNPASVNYGSGIELRFVKGEMELRFSQRFPSYSLRLQSENARLAAGESHRIAVVYRGSSEMRVPASFFRMFVDGEEVGTRVLNDGLPLPDLSGDKQKATTFRIGFDNAPNSTRFAGSISEASAWVRALPFASSTPEWTELLALRRELPTVMVMQEMVTPRETHVLQRGAYDAPGEKVDPGVPEKLLGTWPRGAPQNRLGLAQWLTKPDHPLTSRVVVNRYWQQLFGKGLVKTSDNFGMQGEWPSHPELLDWLATDFVASGWDVKMLLKRIVLSATYRQTSDASTESFARDPENRLLSRGPRFRMPAEMIRDQALQISGLLKPRVGGPSVFPYQPPDLYKGIVVAASYPGTVWTQSKGDDLYRRSLYTYWKRTVPHPTMNVFDAPDREVCTVRRSTTNTPLQALTLLNDPIFVEAARKLAERSIHEGGTAAPGRLGFAFRLATGRDADSKELSILQASFDKSLTAYRKDLAGAKAFVAVGDSSYDQSIPIAELAAYTAVANVILSLDEVITKS